MAERPYNKSITVTETEEDILKSLLRKERESYIGYKVGYFCDRLLKKLQKARAVEVKKHNDN